MVVSRPVVRWSARPTALWVSMVLLLLAACQTPAAVDAGSAVVAAPVAEAGTAVQAAPERSRAASPQPLYGGAPPSGRRVALLLPLSGPRATLGRDLLDAATLALFDIGGDRFELLVADTLGTPEGASSAMRQVLPEGPDLVVGPLFAAEVAAAAALAREARAPVVALSSDLTVAGPGVFLLGLAPEQQIDRVVALAAARGHRRFAVLAPDNGFGRRMVGALEDAVRRHGRELSRRAYYSPLGRGIDETVAAFIGTPSPAVRQASGRLAGSFDFDALLIPESGPVLLEIAAWLGHHDVTSERVRLLGLESWDDPALWREPVLTGAWYAMTPPDRRPWFGTRFRAAFGEDPNDLATLTYDAMALVAALDRDGEGPLGTDAIADWRGFAGVDGIFRFRPDGRPQRGLAVMEIRPDGAVIADPAPVAFARPVLRTAAE